MLSNKYNYQDEEPIIKKVKKTREKKVKEVKESEPEVYKMIRETREARENKIKEVDDDAESDEEDACITPLQSALTTKIEGGSKSGNLALNAFHPMVLHTSKYDTKFIDTLKTENEELKKHLGDLRKLHTFNDRLNNINHTVHRMKIKLNKF